CQLGALHGGGLAHDAVLGNRLAQDDTEQRAAADRARDGHVAAEETGQLADAREAEAGATDLARRRSIDLPELVEDVRQLIGGDADAGILDGDLEPVVAAPARLDDDLALLRELRGVRQQVEQDLAQLELVGLDDRDVVGELRVNLDRLAAHVLLHGRDALVDELGKLELLDDDIELTCLDLREVEDVVDQREQRVRVVLDHVE